MPPPRYCRYRPRLTGKPGPELILSYWMVVELKNLLAEAQTKVYYHFV